MAELMWITAEVALAIHELQLAEHGGWTGVRDAGLLESALARPINRVAYAGDDIPALAASYAFGLAHNHPFVDGNKRAAFAVAATFIELNGRVMTASEADVALTFLALAAGEIDEEALAGWFADNSRKVCLPFWIDNR
jgi:death on curing protein